MAEGIPNLDCGAEPRSEPEPFFYSNDSAFGMGITSGPSFRLRRTMSFEFSIGEITDDNDCFSGEEGYDEVEDDDDYVEESVNFVTDLFESRQPLVVAEDSNWEFDSDGTVEELVGINYEFGPTWDIRIVDMNSGSDSEEFEVNSSILVRDEGNNNDDTGDDHRDGAYIDGIFAINTGYISDGDEAHFEWEEVSERFNRGEREAALNSVIDQIRDISVVSDAYSSTEDVFVPEIDEDEHVRNIEWEVLLAVNNIDRGFDFENPEDVVDEIENVNVVNVNRLPEDYVLAMEYDALFGQLVENANPHKGSPPASKRAVESLETFVAEKGCGGVVTCAVCIDEVAGGEKVTKMPCLHLYHGECILPWLKVRNTCPVCRYELPTDDEDYEKRRASRLIRDGGGGESPGVASGAGDILQPLH